MTKPPQAILTIIASVACSSAFAAGDLEQWELTTRTIGAAGVMPERMVIVCRKRDKAAKPPVPANCKN